MNILAIDQGTTGTTVCLYNQKSEMIGKAYREIRQIYPKPGWVEHDPENIWSSVKDALKELLEKNPVKIAGIGITNQRETTVVWDKRTGKPVYNAIVWQCRRTSAQCQPLKVHEVSFREKTGLPVDPYFSATKIKWILDHSGVKDVNNLLFGTIDTYLIWKLTNGTVHVTDYTNAARTLIFNIKEKKWDDDLLDIMELPKSILPEVKKSIDDFGVVEAIDPIKGIPIYGVAGDQQAALFGQTCFRAGQIKNTYGTGCFAVMNTGDRNILSKNGLITTLAINGDGDPCFALEGSIFIAGAVIQWLRDELNIIDHAADSENLAKEVSDNGGVYIVPAFVGLGAPHWDMDARGIITGLTRGANRKHMVRAALESMAYQTMDVISIMEKESGIGVHELAVDGGATANNFLMQFQADIMNKTVIRPRIIESTSLGAAYLAGLKANVWKSSDELLNLKTIDHQFKPAMDGQTRQALIEGWQNAIRKALTK
ncbi:MAG: glycerol kinase GlpK [Proteobacteria bacterium]|nr:glycerol kinase GlpK [Pseudomonadota bacterium]